MKPVVQSLWIGNKLSLMEIYSIKSYLRLGYDFHLYTYEPVKNVPRGTKIKDGSKILSKETAVIIINMISDALDHKDILKIENRELTSNEVNKISLLAPDATLNIIRNWKVSQKSDITVPDILEVIRCNISVQGALSFVISK